MDNGSSMNFTEHIWIPLVCYSIQLYNQQGNYVIAGKAGSHIDRIQRWEESCAEQVDSI